MDKVIVDRNMLMAVIEGLKNFADNTPIQSYKSMNSLVAIVITLEQALNAKEVTQDG